MASIPATIASHKGRNIIHWYCYGCFLGIFALIHAIALKNSNEERKPNFSGKDFRNVNFTGRELIGANFQNADIRGANFSHAQILGADFSDVNGENTNFNCANIAGTQFDRAVLKNANFSQVKACVRDKGFVLIDRLVPLWVGILVSPFILLFTINSYLLANFFIFIATLVGVTYGAIAAGKKNREKVLEIIGLLSVVIVILMLKTWASLPAVAVLHLAAAAFAIAQTIPAAKAKNWTLFGTWLGALIGFGWLSAMLALNVTHFNYSYGVRNTFIFYNEIVFFWYNLLFLICGAFAGRLTGALLAMRMVSFRGANLTEANFTEASLPDADFSKANLADVNWTNAEVSGAMPKSGDRGPGHTPA